MKQKFIIQENHQKLLIFFAGWACDSTPFEQYRPLNMDYLICYDYRNLEFDYTIFDRYQYINVVAWSMGVWAAGHVLQQSKPHKGISIAYNGTTFPIHNEEGIPCQVFERTLQNLTPANLQKFMRRICGSTEAYKEFMQITPRRNFDEVKEELQTIKKHYCQESGIHWDEDGNMQALSEERDNNLLLNAYFQNYGKDYDLMFIGCKDAIYPVENLKTNQEMTHQVYLEDSPHYDAKAIKLLLEDIWKMPADEFYEKIMKEQ